MITQNELYDLSFSLIKIREDIQNPINIKILECIISVFFKYEQGITDNEVRQTINTVSGLNDRWEFVKHKNYYTHTVFIEIVVDDFISYIKDLKSLLDVGDFEQAYDLADVLHVLPNILVANNGKIPKDFDRVYMRPYVKKWSSI